MAAPMTDKANEIAALLAPTVRRWAWSCSASNTCRRRAARCCACTSTCRRPRSAAQRRHRGLRVGEPRSVRAARCRGSDQRQLHAGSVVAGHRPAAVHARRSSRASSARRRRSRCSLPQDGRRRLQGRIAAVEGDSIVFDVDGKPRSSRVRQHRQGQAGARLGSAGHGAARNPARTPRQQETGRAEVHADAAPTPTSELRA